MGHVKGALTRILTPIEMLEAKVDAQAKHIASLDEQLVSLEERLADLERHNDRQETYEQEQNEH